MSVRAHSRFIDPRLMNRMRGGERVPAVATGDLTVRDEGGTTWRLDDGDVDGRGMDYADGTEGELYLVGSWVHFRSTEEAQAERAERERQSSEWAVRREREEREAAELRETARREAEAFNAEIRVPVRWVPAYKVRWRWLTERSDGTGTGRGTVTHILLREALASGRLRRAAGQLLCGDVVDSDFHHAEDDRDRGLHDGWGVRVSCKGCLRLAERLAARAGES